MELSCGGGGEIIQEDYEMITHSQSPPSSTPYRRPSPPLPKRQSVHPPIQCSNSSDADDQGIKNAFFLQSFFHCARNPLFSIFNTCADEPFENIDSIDRRLAARISCAIHVYFDQVFKPPSFI